MAKFKTRARTVDMLGRQQIAGAPTAISELFKNAHDAYARRVEVDYYRNENLFLLRDDGLGMTERDFQERWLTIGTDSKVGGEILLHRPHGLKERPIMGEKGIGRLAIARIGPQVLVMSRALRDEELHDLVVALVNWELFELPGINLDEIEIPVETCPGGKLPDIEQINRLKAGLQTVVKALKSRVSSERIFAIEQQIEGFQVDPQRIDRFFNSTNVLGPNGRPLSLSDQGFGTHFLIQPADPFLGEDIDRDQKSADDPTFTKFLVGFANTMTPDAASPHVLTLFRDWRYPETANELIGGGAFLTADDFRDADHHFSGQFDEFGQFEGEVKIYDQPPVRHVIPWDGSQGRYTSCGPFQINIAHLQGVARESRVPNEVHANLTKKLNRFGGLYVYRDGIRILPYGNSDQDWLNIETRRNKGQTYYFFAYRRIFGVVEITQRNNSALVEKAGREGFQTNKAYRQFTAILENFFIQLAADFFRETGTKATLYTARKEELSRAELARRKREDGISFRRKQFAVALEKFFVKIEGDEPRSDVAVIIEGLDRELERTRNQQDNDRAAIRLIEAEASAIRALCGLGKKYMVTRPREIGLSSQLRRDWESYLVAREELEAEVFMPAMEKLNLMISNMADKASIKVDQRKRLQTLVEERSAEAQKSIANQVAELRKSADLRLQEFESFSKNSLSIIKEHMEEVRAELNRLDLTDLQPSEIEHIRQTFELKIDRAANRLRDALESAQQQLLDVRVNAGEGDEPSISSGEITGVIEEEVIALREAADADAELVQLGMALAVVTHEFDAVIRSIRSELKRLKAWADATPELRPIYNRIHINFEHLDGYLALFTPLQRRLYRKPQKISGAEISTFLQELFSDRFKRHNITLSATNEFRNRTLIGYPSTFYPVFVNLVDNAIYWLKDQKNPRLISLDSDDLGILICNNGPGISARDRERIFELRFTRKPGGRGMGLYISRHTLEKVGYQLTIEAHNEFPVCFRISEQPKAEIIHES